MIANLRLYLPNLLINIKNSNWIQLLPFTITTFTKLAGVLTESEISWYLYDSIIFISSKANMQILSTGSKSGPCRLQNSLTYAPTLQFRLTYIVMESLFGTVGDKPLDPKHVSKWPHCIKAALALPNWHSKFFIFLF